MIGELDENIESSMEMTCHRSRLILTGSWPLYSSALRILSKDLTGAMRRGYHDR